MRRRHALLGGLVAPWLPRQALAQTGTLDVAEEAGATAAPMPVHYHRPARWQAGGPVVAVLHGVQRNGATYRDAWVAQAEAMGAPFHWELSTVPGVGHSNAGMAAAAGSFLQG